ncbi:MAG: hypothetical protein LBE95_01605 [Holosporaceae bacterium]|nr:hypothetical protein [Holosporaceae bacterium]
MFAGISEESKAFLKIGVSSTMTSNMGASYGLGAKATLSQTVTTLESWINSLKKMIEKLKEINGKYYEFVPQEKLVRIDTSLKDFNSLRDNLVLIRDSKRVQLAKAKPAIVDLNETYAAFKTVLEEGNLVLAAMGKPNTYGTEEVEALASTFEGTLKTEATFQIDENKVRDKNVQKATKAYKEAQDNFCSVIRQFILTAKQMKFRAIPVLKLKISQEEANKDDTFKKVGETMAALVELNEKTKEFCTEIGATFYDSEE